MNHVLPRRRDLLAAGLATWLARSTVAQSPTVRRENGFLAVTGRHVNLTTDTDNVELSRQMVEAFDTALPQWLTIWKVPHSRAGDWKIDAYWMRAADRFTAAGWLPADTPPFKFGYSSATTIWCHEQPSDYYNRHLLMHEGVHAAALNCFGGIGPAWYGEGTAEWMATHQMGGSGPLVGRVPGAASEAEHWGRVPLIQKAWAHNGVPPLTEVMSRSGRIDGDVEAYTWFWLAALLWTSNGATREPFLAMTADIGLSDRAFNRRLYQAAREHWPAMLATWRLLAEIMDFGFDPAIHLPMLPGPGAAHQGQTLRFEVAEHGGWQSPGVWFPAGTRLKLSIAGRNRIGGLSIGPGGDTERRYRGRPLGRLLAAELPIANPAGDRLPSLPVRPVTGWIEGQALIDRLANADQPWTTWWDVERPSWWVFKINRPLDRVDPAEGSGMMIELSSPDAAG